MKTAHLFFGISKGDMKKRNNGQWTESRYENFIKSALRRASVKWPPKYLTLNEAFVESRVNIKSGRVAKHYRCNSCKNLFPNKEVEVNHIVPVVPITGFDSWDGLIDRLFCEKDKLEVLCKPCHKILTKEENAKRREHSK